MQLLPKLPSTIDPLTITVSNSPGSRGDRKKVAEVASISISQIGLGYASPLEDAVVCVLV